jgi:hypothetical protein
MLENYVQKWNEILKIPRCFKALELLYHFQMFSVATRATFAKCLVAR